MTDRPLDAEIRAMHRNANEADQAVRDAAAQAIEDETDTILARELDAEIAALTNDDRPSDPTTGTPPT